MVAVVYQPPPPFRHGTSFGEGMGLVFGPVGMVTADLQAKSTGERVRARISLDDPVFRVRDRFLAGLAADLGIAQPSAQEVFESDDIEVLRQELGSSGLVLDFRTLNWGIGATSNLVGANKYGVGYIGGARLIRLEESKILWKGLCMSGTRDDKKATLVTLQENDGALLKEWLAEAAEVCADSLLSQFAGKNRTSQ